MSFSNPKLSKDCLWQIFEIITNTHKSKEIHTTLFSCLLVNRQWCELAAPFLWKNPFINPNLRNKNKKLLCKIILSCSLLKDTTVIKKHIKKILANSLPKLKIPLFDYVSYIRCFNSTEIEMMAHLLFTSEEWIHHKDDYYDAHSLINDLWKLFIYHCSSPISFKNVPFKLDTNLFVIGKTFFSRITELDCDNSEKYDQELVTATYKNISKICRNIQKINVDRFDRDNEGLAYLISNQKNLKEFHMVMSERVIYTNIVKEIRSQSNSLTHLSFKGEVKLPKDTFESLIHLKSLSLKLNHECGIRHHKEENEVLSSTNILRALSDSFLPNLENFYLKYNNDVSVPWLQPLHIFQKLISTTRNNSLRKIDIDSKFSIYPDTHIHSYIQTISTFCPLIEFLGICYKDTIYEDFEQLLLNCDRLKILKLEFIKEPLIQIEYDDGEGNRRKYTKIMELLADQSPDPLFKLYLKNPLFITKYNLWDFLDMWKNNERIPLHLELVGMIEVKEDYDEVFENFVRKNILSKYSTIKGKSFENI
ncbi:unnamed protein product [Rhizophagus irregularis]|nr:unnamed protein product [Rhizophagus irregularis]CAB4421349.1 unnamed protein product [Rhizophagus irregularis]